MTYKSPEYLFVTLTMLYGLEFYIIIQMGTGLTIFTQLTTSDFYYLLGKIWLVQYYVPVWYLKS